MNLRERILRLLNGVSYEVFLKQRIRADKLDVKLKEKENITKKVAIENVGLKWRLYPNNDLNEFKEYLDATLEGYFKYHTNSNGERFYPHKWLQTNRETDNLYDDWIKNDKLIFENHDTDDAIYYLTMHIHEILRKNGYATDLQKWKVSEYWLTPQEALNILVFAEEKGDCEDYGILLYTAIRRMLTIRGEWEENKWRLKSFLVNIIGGGYHYSVAWAKKGPNNYINLETTYAPYLFDYCWKNDYPLEGNWLYNIDYSFDNERSYKKMKLR